MASAIYAIVNQHTKDMYVGSSVNIKRRWSAHSRQLRTKKHYSEHLQNAYIKYGAEAFDWEIVEYVEDKTTLIKREQLWIDFFQPLYNKRSIANSPLGTKHSAETRAKMSASAKNKIFTHEHKSNISKAKKGICTTSEDQKQRLSELNKGKVLSVETKAKISASLIGNTRAINTQFTTDERLRRSKSMSGNTWASGTKRSIEQCAAISEQMKAVWAKRKQQKEVKL
jgi:group I intron endonuclease